MRSRVATAIGGVLGLAAALLFLFGSASAASLSLFTKASFCGRYLSSYNALYQPSTASPGSITEGIWALEAAVLTVDGRGNITNGELTQNALGPAASPQQCSITGAKTYTVGSSPQGVPGYISMNPTYSCFASTCDPTTGLCTFSNSPYGSGTIQWACYLSDISGSTVVCTELGSSGFTPAGVPISSPGRAVTWTRTSVLGCLF